MSMMLASFIFLALIVSVLSSPTSKRTSYLIAMEKIRQNSLQRNGHAQPTEITIINSKSPVSHLEEYPDFRSLTAFPEVREVNQHIEQSPVGVSDFEDAEFLFRSTKLESPETDGMMELSESRYVEPEIRYAEIPKPSTNSSLKYKNIVSSNGEMLSNVDRSRYPILFEWLQDVTYKPNPTLSSSNDDTNTSEVSFIRKEDPTLINITSIFEELGADTKKVWGPSFTCQSKKNRFCTIEEDPATETLDFISRQFSDVLKVFSPPLSNNTSAGPISDISNEGKTCTTEVSTIYPTWFIDTSTNLWVIALQTPQIKQSIRRESCSTSFSPCKYVIPYYESSCMPNVIAHPVLSWDPTKPTHLLTSYFITEGGCTCQIKMLEVK